ncbi:NAD(P)/FAD-dependent oxidoreductase [Maribacter chungangensis]|uniref:NAD(P)/FAD-dependent oxidoreductase n=1 Tax=Maribacter chungangensis TaxID=1069117 RepID=A0ABW3B6Q8_9FLAO
MLDYIVVGLGLAGTAFCETLRKQNKRFAVFNDSSQNASLVAGGLSNPVILKRFTMAWNANTLIPVANTFYHGLERTLGKKLLTDLPVYRRFVSVAEQNMWFEAADKKDLKKYLSQKLVRNSNKVLIAPHDFGEVMYAGLLDTQRTLKSYTAFLKEQGILVSDGFDHAKLEQSSTHVTYGALTANYIVFAEGFGLLKNPFFNYLPMQGSKGEYLIIKCAALKENNAIKSSVFVIPLGNDLYKVGANYDRDTSSNLPTEATKRELMKKLNELLACPYEVVGHQAGIRPTVKDRKPLVGKHPEHHRLFVLNGYGSHGIMIAPWAAAQLFASIENCTALHPEVDIKRYAGDYK